MKEIYFEYFMFVFRDLYKSASTVGTGVPQSV